MPLNPTPAPPAIWTSALEKRFGPTVALDGVDLVVEPGEFVVLVGPNGAGKTTLLRILATLARPSSGELRIAGLDPAVEGRAIRRRIGFLSHRTLLYGELSAEENLALYARLYRLEEPAARIDALLHRVDLAWRRGDLVRTLSRGMQQRLAVARAVLHRPSLLLLDEPYTGLDPLAAEALTALLGELAEGGGTVLLTTHTLEGLGAAERRVVVLNRGRIVHDGVVAEWGAFPRLYRRLVLEEAKVGAPISLVEERPPEGEVEESRGGALAAVLAIVRKDLAAELHTREMVNAMFVFAVLTLLIFSFALDLRGATARAAAPGVLWTAVAFAGTLGLSRSLAREEQSGAIEGLLLAPVDRVTLFFGKALGNLLLMLFVEGVLLLLGSVLFDVPLLQPAVLLVMVLGTVGYAAVGTLLAAVAVNTRAREVMLPILLLPLAIPLFIGAVRATGGLLEGLALAEINAWLRLVVVYDLLMVAVSMVTFEYVIAE